MAHGYFDYGRDLTKDTVYSIHDEAEQAARLWSPNTFDRLGDTLFMDGFEGSLNKWRITLSGAGAQAYISNEKARNGGFSCHLIGGSDLNRQAEITHEQAYPVLSNLGFEMSFLQAGTIEYIYCNIYAHTWTQQFHWFWAYLDNGVFTLSVRNGFLPVVIHTFPGQIYCNAAGTLFHTVKMGVNPNTGAYRYLIFDDLRFNLAAYTAWITAAAGNPYLYMDITMRSRSGNNDEVFIDDVIITHNEP